MLGWEGTLASPLIPTPGNCSISLVDVGMGGDACVARVPVYIDQIPRLRSHLPVAGDASVPSPPNPTPAPTGFEDFICERYMRLHPKYAKRSMNVLDLRGSAVNAPRMHPPYPL